jgi:hypothetical protein
VLADLAREAREGGPKTREGLRASAEAYAESAGLSPEARAATREALGRRIVQALTERANAGQGPAHDIAFTLAQGRTLAAGAPDDGLTRFEAEQWVDGCLVLVTLAADAPFEPTAEQREVQRAGLLARWEAWKPEERAAARAAARAVADLPAAWTQADAVKRLAFRAHVAGRLVPPVGGSPAGWVAPDAKALRAHLDRSERRPDALLASACSLDPDQRLRLHALLSAEPPR